MADKTNACMAQLMGNAYQQGTTLTYDQILRREMKSEGLKTYPEAIIQCHEILVQKIRDSSEAKVEIVHGEAVKLWMEKRPSYNYDVLSLWSSFKGINITLESETNFQNAQPEHRYRRILVFVRHPNRLFYRSASASIHQDLLIEVAAKIAQVDFVERYYTEENWRKLVPVDLKNRAVREQYGMFVSCWVERH